MRSHGQRLIAALFIGVALLTAEVGIVPASAAQLGVITQLLPQRATFVCPTPDPVPPPSPTDIPCS